MALFVNQLIGFDAFGAGGVCTQILGAGGFTVIGSMTTLPAANAFNDSTNTPPTFQTGANSAAKAAAPGFVGLDFTVGITKVICKVVAYSSTDLGWSGDNANTTITARGDNSAPTVGTEGNSLGTSGSIANANSATQTFTVTDATPYRYVWVYVAPASGTSYCSQCRIWWNV